MTHLGAPASSRLRSFFSLLLATVLPLPGGLDKTPMFNSNSPEVVQQSGVLLNPDYTFNGDFNIFFHHIAKDAPNSIRILVENPGNDLALVQIKRAASYLSQPDAPFIELPPIVETTDTLMYAGPGDRVMTEYLAGRNETGSPKVVPVAPHGSVTLLEYSIPVEGLVPPLNGRSALFNIRTDKPVKLKAIGIVANSPAVSETALAGPREKPASASIYGRVSAVQIGSTWKADVPVSLPLREGSVSFPISSVSRGTFGTGQIQSAPLAVRTPETAVAAHGNYGVHYDLNFKLKNTSKQPLQVALRLQSPLKSDEAGPLKFLNPPGPQVFFRGTIKVSYSDNGKVITRLFHLVLKRGDEGQPTPSFTVPPKKEKQVRVELYYTPDSTPPQVLTIETAPRC